MKVLLDECLPTAFRHHLPMFDVHTVEWAGLKGLKNGQLLREAEAAEHDVFLTSDQGIRYQQNLEQRRIAIVVLRTSTNRWKTFWGQLMRFARHWRAWSPARS